MSQQRLMQECFEQSYSQEWEKAGDHDRSVWEAAWWASRAVLEKEAKAAPVGERLVVTVVDPDCRTTTEHVITERDVILLWNRIDTLERQQAREVVMPNAVSVSADWLKHIHRDLDACQKLIWANLRGCDPAYCADAQERLAEIDAMLARLNKGAGSHE